MKKYNIIIMFILIMFSSCKQNDSIVLIEDEQINIELNSMYIPTPIKNNSMFTHWEVEGHNIIFTELYDIIEHLKSFDHIKIKANYTTFAADDIFSFSCGDTTCAVSAQKFTNYPREITIPEYYIDKNVTSISSYGFMNLHNLFIVNLPNSIASIRSYAFYNTSLYKITNYGKLNTSSFSNTLLEDYPNFNITLSKGIITRKIDFKNKNINLEINLNGGYIIEEEFALFFSRPTLDNKIFLYYENEEGTKIKFNNNSHYYNIPLIEYVKSHLGTTFKIISEPVNESIFRFVYLNESDSYSISLIKNNLQIYKLIIPSEYNNKKITKINILNNKYIEELVIPNTIVNVNIDLNLPNLKKIYYNNNVYKTIEEMINNY